MNASGRARVENEIIDISVLIDTGLKGIHAFLGKTERGIVGKSVLVGSWNEYVKHFGGLLEDSDFPLFCRRTLERGGKLRIGRVAHYGDVTDKTTLDGTVATASIGGVTFNANSIGAWGNDLKVTIVDAYNGVADEVDVTIDLDGYPDLSQTITNLPNVLTNSEINRFNAESRLVVLDAVANDPIAPATITPLTGGVQDLSLIVPADYKGDPIANTGLHVFDNDADFVRVSIPELAIPEIDMYLINYVEMRQDCRAILRTPTGIDGITALDYRNGTGAYSHQAIDSWRGSMIFGGLEIIDPKDDGEKIVPALPDVAGAMSVKDNKQSSWFATAGSKRGRVRNALGIEYNLGSPARGTEFDQIDVHGINPVINDPDFGLVYWGNGTLQKKNTLLRHENVAELLIFLSRMINPIVKADLFDPNDVETWAGLYRKLRPALQAVKDRRGIWKYFYQGDQHIDDISQATVNDPNDVDSGKYVFHLWIAPKVGMKYVGIKTIITNSGVDFEELSGQPAL